MREIFTMRWLCGAVEFASAAKVWVPAWLFQPKKRDAARPLVVVIEPSGRGGWHEGDLYDALALRGCRVRFGSEGMGPRMVVPAQEARCGAPAGCGDRT